MSTVSKTHLQFEITGGAVSDSVIATFKPTFYGWTALEYDDGANGTYALKNVASSNG